MKSAKHILLLLIFAAHLSAAEETITELETFEVSHSVKGQDDTRRLPVAAQTFTLTEIDRRNTASIKDVSSLVPNFHLPDYGTQMTASIYVRGFGTRIDHPVVSMIVDDVPLLNKNTFDFDLFDLSRADFLRGPQGTLYGRNAMCGLIHLRTISPFSFQGSRFSADFSTGTTVKAKASTYRKKNDGFAYSVAAHFMHTNGFFENMLKDEKCDPSNGLTVRSRQMWKNNELRIENAVSAGVLEQGGYAYANVTDNKRQPIAYNDICRYDRINITDGLVVTKSFDKFDLSSVTSYQLLIDDMKMDQDFTPSPFFTLNQKQNEHAFTEEIVLKTKNKNKLWNSKTGMYAFYKHNDTEAPVTFKRDGIETLIIANANKGIRTMFSEDELDIKENRFVISSDFELPSTGVAVYHQSEFRCGRWNFTGGIRIDYEHDKMQYANEANLHYIFTLLMDDYKKLQTKLNGTAKMDFIEVLPKFAVQYNLNEHNNIYASFAKGYKAGGFNTQIFSDILQTQLKSDMMTDMGMKFDGMNDTSYDISKATSYEPEHNWTFELGCHLTFDGNSNRIKADISAFYIDCRNQQLTVFPHGKNTGRMMANAGESSSVGIESALSLHVNRMDIYTSYGYTYAIFEDFDDGVTDYTGNFLPYAPQHTAAAQVSYTCRIGKKILDDIILTVDWKGTGKIYWNESNTVQQPFYSLYGASVAFSKNDFNLKIWSKNLTDEKYDTFFFTSLGNNFCQSGKPRQMGVTASYSL